MITTLKAKGVRVPDGVCTTADAFRLARRRPPLAPGVSGVC